MAAKQLVAEHKCILVREFDDYLNPYGERLLSRCFWPVLFKRTGVEFWLKACDRFGAPWATAVAQGDITAEQRAFALAALERLTSTGCAALSGGWDVKISEASGKFGDIYKQLLFYWDAAISKVIMGQTLTADVGESGSTHAASKTHEDILTQLAGADASLVKSFFEDLAWTYGQVNAPTEESPTWDYEEPEDLLAKAKLFKEVQGLGARFRKDFLAAQFKLPEDAFDLVAPAPSAEPSVDKTDLAAQPAESNPTLAPGQALIDQAAESILAEARAASAAMSERIAQAVERAETWEDLQLLLAELQAEDSTDAELRELMERIMLAAAMVGKVAGGADVRA